MWEDLVDTPSGHDVTAQEEGNQVIPSWLQRLLTGQIHSDKTSFS
jgi:hypothetical protein